MSPETLHLLRRCLASQTLQVGDPDFAATAHTAAQALAELDQAIADATTPTTEGAPP